MLETPTLVGVILIGIVAVLWWVYRRRRGHPDNKTAPMAKQSAARRTGFAFKYLPGPDWFWSLVGFAGYFGMCFLIHERFDGFRI
jgi:bacteriorhodopsin